MDIRRRASFAALTFSLLLALAAGAEAQRLTKGELTGVIVSKQVEMAAPVQATLVTAPTSGSLVITQACVSSGQADDPTRIAGSTFGKIIEVGAISEEQCLTFEPGLAMPPGDDVVCVNTGLQGGSRLPRCLVTGVMTNK